MSHDLHTAIVLTHRSVADVTVVIPTKDRPSMLHAALRSIEAQTMPPTAVLVVDDGSDPRHAARVAEVAGPVAELIRHETSRGVAAARNVGLAAATTEWICFLDDDDVWAPGHLEGLLAAAERSPQPADLVFSGYVLTDAWRNPLAVRNACRADDMQRELLGRNRIGTPSCVMLRTATVRRLGGFDGTFSIAADWDMWLRVAEAGRLVSADQLSVGYMLHPGSMQRTPATAVEEISVLQRKHAPAIARHGVTMPDGSFPGYIASHYAEGGNRRQATRWFARSARLNRSGIDALRAMMSVWSPLAVAVIQRRVRRRGLRGRSREFSWLEDR